MPRRTHPAPPEPAGHALDESCENKLTRDRRRCRRITSWPGELGGTSSIKDKQPTHLNRPSEPPVSGHFPTTILQLFTYSFACSIANPSPDLPTDLLAPADALRSRLRNALNAAGHRWPDACQHRIAYKAAYQTERPCFPETLSTSTIETAEHSTTQDIPQCPETDAKDAWRAGPASTCL